MQTEQPRVPVSDPLGKSLAGTRGPCQVAQIVGVFSGWILKAPCDEDSGFRDGGFLGGGLRQFKVNFKWVLLYRWVHAYRIRLWTMKLRPCIISYPIIISTRYVDHEPLSLSSSP